MAARWLFSRIAVSARIFPLALAALIAVTGSAFAQAVVNVGPPSSVLSNAHASATFPVTMTRPSSISMLGFSVVFTRSGNLTLPSGNGSIQEGAFLGSDGHPTTFQVRDLGGGQYAADGVTLGVPCGTTALTGTLFSISVASADPSGTGTITINSVVLRDCSNATIPSTTGTSGSVTIDHSVPSVSVITPSINERWLVGSSNEITWTATDAEGFNPGAITIESSIDNGGSWSPVASALDNTGTFSWTVPAPVALQARIRVTAVDQNGNTASASSSVFNILKATITTLAPIPTPSRFGDPITLTATVSFTPPGADVATGSILFFDGQDVIATVPVTSNSGSTSISSLAVGLHAIRAVYSGDPLYDASGSTVQSVEVMAEIVATAGPNGLISPSGATLYSLNATPSYTFSANPGYHVFSVTVDGLGVALTSPYTFAPVSSNHTIDVQFAVNPAVAAISTLASSTVRTGNGSSGRMRIAVSWSPVPVGSTVEVYRAPYGNYPEYNGNPTPGSVPATPSYPPGAPWVLTSVTSPGDVDLPPTRDFYYHVAFVTDGFGTKSPVSNVTPGALDYALGDVSNGVTAGAGDNLVSLLDISLLGSVYGRVLTPGDAFNYLDVGPTTDFSVNGRPVTDDHVNFEDLVMFGLNFGQVSAPAALLAGSNTGHDELQLVAPADVASGATFDVRVMLHGSGAVHALSTTLSWDPAAAEPVGSVDAGSALAGNAGVALSPAAGVVDVAVFGAETPGLSGDAEVAVVHFRALRAGAPGVVVSRVDGRDALNHHVAVTSLTAGVIQRPSSTRLDAAVPSPFRDRTTLGFALSRPGNVELAVFSVDGRKVRTLASGFRDAGEYHVEWDGRDDAAQFSAAGVYYLRLTSAQAHFTRRLTLIH